MPFFKALAIHAIAVAVVFGIPSIITIGAIVLIAR